jgi:hypothetical protein
MSTLARFGVDASYDWPTGAELNARGVTAVMDYITDPGPGNKGCTQARWDDRGKYGISQGLVWELGNSAVLGGFAQGVADATRAQHNLRQLKGPSNTRPLYFAIDFDIQPPDYPTARQYFLGVNSVIGVRRSGVYGHADIIDYLDRQRVVQKKWQTYAWSRGVVYPQLDIYQYSNGHLLGSGTVDYCHFNISGNWGQSGVIFAPAPRPQGQPAPQPDPQVLYTVAANDTLTSIAAHFGTSVLHLLALNKNITDPNLIEVGQKVRVK